MLFKHGCAQDPRGDDGSVVEPLSGTLGDLRTGVWASNLLVCRLKALPEPSATELDLWLLVGWVCCLCFQKNKNKTKDKKHTVVVYVYACFGFICKLSC